MSMQRVKTWMRDGRVYELMVDPATQQAAVAVVTPPSAIDAHAQRLADLKANRQERARKAEGLHLAATFTKGERDNLHKAGIRLGDTDALKWALKQDEWRHAKVGS